MSGDLTRAAKTLVDNLQRTQTPKIIDEVTREEIPRLQTSWQKTTTQERLPDEERAFRESKRFLLSTAIPEKSHVESIMKIPELIGFKPSTRDWPDTQVALDEKSRKAAVSILWLSAIPRNTIGSGAGADELRKESIDLLMRDLLQSNESRDLFVAAVRAEMKERGLKYQDFEIRNVLSGYDTEDPQVSRLIPAAISLIMIDSTSLPYDHECLVRQDKEQLTRATAAYVVIFHVMRHLRQIISGNAHNRPFDWPMVGDKRVLSRVSAAFNLLETTSADARCCTFFSGKETDDTASVGQRTVSVFLDELTAHYSNALKSRRGKGTSDDLASFIDSLTTKKREISTRVSESQDKGDALQTELLTVRNKAKATIKQARSPETVYVESLNLLEGRLKVRARAAGFDTALADELKPVFDSIVQIIEKNKETLGEDRERFAEALSFETCFKILDYLDFGQYILDLSWVSRLIAEECMRGRYVGPSESKPRTNREERIVTAHEAGLIYLILQSRQSGSV